MPKKRSKFSINFRILIDLFAVVMVWRGAWMLLDTYLLPNFPLLSAILSIGAGLAVFLLDDQLLEELKH